MNYLTATGKLPNPFFVATGSNVYHDVTESHGTLADIGVKSPNIEGSCDSRKARVSEVGKFSMLNENVFLC